MSCGPPSPRPPIAGRPGGHRLDERHAKGFVNSRHHEHVAPRQFAQRPLVGQLAREADAISEPQLERQPLQRLAFLPVADHEIRRPDLGLEQRQRPQHRRVVLARLQVGDRDERQLVALVDDRLCRPPGAAEGTSAPRWTTVAGSGCEAISSQRSRAQPLLATTRSAVSSATMQAWRPTELRSGTSNMSGPCAETANAGRSPRPHRRRARRGCASRAPPRARPGPGSGRAADRSASGNRADRARGPASAPSSNPSFRRRSAAAVRSRGPTRS